MHFQGGVCALTGAVDSLELHHILGKGSGRGDDVRENLAWLSHDRHERITRNDPVACAEFRSYLDSARPDTLLYLRQKFGNWTAALDFLDRRYPLLGI